jgi:outer membrane murein-binding lipoprotein Lpp
LAERARAVHDRLARLLRDHAELQRRSAKLTAAAQEQHRMVETLRARVAELERENEVLRNAKPAGRRDPAPGTKERIDELVNEIDRCLALIQG